MEIAMQDKIEAGYEPTPEESARFHASKPLEGTPTKFAQWQLPGGTNYKETNLYSNNVEDWDNFPDAHRYSGGSEDLKRVAHMRTNERVDAEGRPGSFSEEYQSDRHQNGRKHGYSGGGEIDSDLLLWASPKNLSQKEYDQLIDTLRERYNVADANEENSVYEKELEAQRHGIPDAPYRKSSEWGLRLFKQQLRDAVKSGKEWVGWTDGKTQADRYKLSTVVRLIEWNAYDERGAEKLVTIKPIAGNLIELPIMPDGTVKKGTGTQFDGKMLDEVVGKPIAETIMAQSRGTLSGNGLDIGGEGMKGFYDTIMPKAVGDYAAQWGAKVEKGKVAYVETFDGSAGIGQSQGYGSSQIWKVDITPEMRSSVSEGQPLFMVETDAPQLLQNDLREQRAWIQAKAREMGFEDATDMALRDPGAFAALSEEWRETHPRTNEAGETRFMAAVEAGEVEVLPPEKAAAKKPLTRAIINKLERGPKLVRYRAMALMDGKLYPPMSTMIEGSRRPAEPIGEWMQSEERPDLVPKSGRNAGKFRLKGPNGDDVWATYAPYFHSSQNPLNDQFSAAYKKPLVTVEIEIPDGDQYQADGSKRATGEHSWPGGRKVDLSRYAKIRRIVPDREVARLIAQSLPKGAEVADNVVTPSLRKELEKAGVPILVSGIVPANQTRFMTESGLTDGLENVGSQNVERTTEEGILPKSIFRVDSPESRGDFRLSIETAAKAHKFGAAVDIKDAEFYADPANTIYLAPDNLRGAAVTKDGDLVSVFRHPDSKESIRPLLSEASEIATHLDAYDIDGILPDLYSNFGFRPVARVEFDLKYKPDWDVELFGLPDVVLMVKDSNGVTDLPEVPKDGGYESIKDQVPILSYDDAVAAQQAAVQSIKDQIRFMPETEAPVDITGNTPVLRSIGWDASKINVEEIKGRTIAGNTVGSRSPTAVNATESGVDPANVVDLEVMRRNPDQYKTNAIAVAQYPLVARELPEIAAKIRKIYKKTEQINADKETVSKNLKGLKTELKKLTKNQGTEKQVNRVLEKIQKEQNKLDQLEKDKVAERTVANEKLDKFANSKEFTMEIADKVYETLVKATEENLRVLYDLFPEEYRHIAQLWYDGANLIAQKFGERYGTTLNRASAVLAVFSPQKDWFMNVSLAERTMSIFQDHQDAVWTPEMSKQYIMREGNPEELEPNEKGERQWEKKAQPIFAEGLTEEEKQTAEPIGFTNWKTEVAAQKVAKAKKLLESLENRKLEDLIAEDKANGKFELSPKFIRMFSEVYHHANFPIVSPDGQFVRPQTTTKGALSKVAWGGYNTIEKALAILTSSQEAELQTISDSLGDAHKVRSFYNNIVDPQNTSGHITMDTHAIAALLWLPLSGGSLEVGHNFGTKPGVSGSSETGIGGTYAVNAKAYRDLAKILSDEMSAKAGKPVVLLPRELQSITWEAVRLLFPAKFKSQSKNVKAIREIWSKYERGEFDQSEARDQIFKTRFPHRN